MIDKPTLTLVFWIGLLTFWISMPFLDFYIKYRNEKNKLKEAKAISDALDAASRKQPEKPSKGMLPYL